MTWRREIAEVKFEWFASGVEGQSSETVAVGQDGSISRTMQYAAMTMA